MSRSPAWVPFASSLVLLAGVMLGAAEIVQAGDMTEKTRMIIHGSAIAMAAIALGAIIRAIGVLIERQGKSTATDPRVVDLLQQIEAALEQLPANLSTLLAVNSEEKPAQQFAPAALPSELTRAMEKMVELLEEIREASTMDESQRQARQRALRDRMKAVTIADAASAIQSQQWAKADKLIVGLEADYPGDEAIAELHRKLAAGRDAAEGEAAAKIRDRVEDLMAISSWEEAYATALQFAENFPQNAAGNSLLQRVTRERDIFNESTVHQLYEEIKSDLERRRWRRALAGAQRLLERFPDHRKTEKVRAQLRTIQDNAEIEERQEQEAKIQDLIRAKRFPEAIELAEDLLDRFPLSPQAGSLEELLPKMRELAMQQAIETEAAQHR